MHQMLEGSDAYPPCNCLLPVHNRPSHELTSHDEEMPLQALWDHLTVSIELCFLQQVQLREFVRSANTPIETPHSWPWHEPQERISAHHSRWVVSTLHP